MDKMFCSKNLMCWKPDGHAGQCADLIGNLWPAGLPPIEKEQTEIEVAPVAPKMSDEAGPTHAWRVPKYLVRKIW